MSFYLERLRYTTTFIMICTPYLNLLYLESVRTLNIVYNIVILKIVNGWEIQYITSHYISNFLPKNNTT